MKERKQMRRGRNKANEKRKRLAKNNNKKECT